MARLIEDTTGKIRDLPITNELRQLLIDAAVAACVDLVRVISGGQAALGTPGKRTGSTRHDLGRAADLRLENGGRSLDFTKPSERPYFEAFVERTAALGATGIGAGVTYMGRNTIHVGYGAPAVWGAGGKAVNAPEWLRRAVHKGQSGTGSTPTQTVVPPLANRGTDGRYVVVARSGLSLRSGPGTSFARLAVLQRGLHLDARFDPQTPGWAQVDLESDGLSDGYVFEAYIAPA